MNRVETFINGNNEIKKKIPLFIEAFVKFYGEEYRNQIEEKFNNLLCLGYQTPESIERGLILLEEEKTKKLLEEIFKNIGMLSIELPKHLNFKYKEVMSINYLYKLVDLYKLGENGRKQKFYKEAFEKLNNNLDINEEEFLELIKTKEIPKKYENLPQYEKNNIIYIINEQRIESEYKKAFNESKLILENIIPGINENNFEELLNNEIIEKIYNTKSEYELAYDKFKKYQEELKPYYNEVEEINILKTNIKSEIYNEFIQENIDLFNDNHRVEIEKYLIKENKYLNSNLKQIIGSTLEAHSYIEDFSEEADNFLNNSTNTWKKNTIKKNRIEYFKAMGIDLGNNYDDYMNNENIKEIIPTKERIEKFIKSKNYFMNKYNNKFYTSQERYKVLLKEIENIDFVDKETPIDARMYVEGTSFISPNFIKKENIHKSYPILCINFSNYDTNSLDHVIVHELNHVYETNISLVGENNYEFYCGWDILNGQINERQSEEVDTIEKITMRKYELFSEIINEKIAKEISKIMHEENMYIFDNPNNSTYKNTTGYEHSSFLVNDFFDEFKDIIIKSRSNGNIQLLFDEIGKENFDNLNELFNIYNENFNGMKIYNLYSALEKKEETNETRIYYQLKDKRDKILENMRNYRENNVIKGETL